MSKGDEEIKRVSSCRPNTPAPVIPPAKVRSLAAVYGSWSCKLGSDFLTTNYTYIAISLPTMHNKFPGPHILDCDNFFNIHSTSIY
jgi:hypothetical protein